MLFFRKICDWRYVILHYLLEFTTFAVDDDPNTSLSCTGNHWTAGSTVITAIPPQLREPVAMPFDLIWVYPGWNESIDANIFLNDLFVITGLNLNNCYSLNILSGKCMGYLSIFSWILSALVNHILNLDSPKFFMKDINVMRMVNFIYLINWQEASCCSTFRKLPKCRLGSRLYNIHVCTINNSPKSPN